MQPFGDSDILSLVRISRLNWIGRVNRMDIKRKLSQVFLNNSQGSRLRGRPKNKLWNCVQILIDTKWKTGKRGKKKTALTGRSPLRRRTSALDMFNKHQLMHIMCALVGVYWTYLIWKCTVNTMLSPHWTLVPYKKEKSVNYEPTFRDNLSVTYSRVNRSMKKTSWTLKMGPIVCPETSGRRYHSTLRNKSHAIFTRKA